MLLRGLLLLERSNATDPRSGYVLAPADILPDSGPAPAHLLCLKSRDPAALLHPLDDLKARSHLLEQGGQFCSQFSILGNLLLEDAFQDRLVAFGLLFEAGYGVCLLFVPSPSGFKGAKKGLGLLVGLFAGALDELLRSHGRVGHQYRHDVRRQGYCYRIHPLTTLPLLTATEDGTIHRQRRRAPAG